MYRCTLARLASLLLLATPLPALAEAPFLFETATLGTTGWTGGFIIGTEFRGAKFEVAESIRIHSLGGHLWGTGGDLLVAVVPLSADTDLPATADLSDALFVTNFTPPYPSDEVIISADFTLPPGRYGIVFASGLLGATGAGAMPFTNTEIGSPEYFYWNGEWADSTVFDLRFFVAGGPTAYVEDGDAESFPDGGAQQTVGQPASDSLALISGRTGCPGPVCDFRDAYCIRIADPGTFVATTDPRVDSAAGADFFTNLFLFDGYGTALLANNVTPPSDGFFLSTLRGAASDGSGFALPGAGSYVLVVAGHPDQPLAEDDGPLFDLSNDEAVLSVSGGEFDHWAWEGSTVLFEGDSAGGYPVMGNYTVALRGAMPCSPLASVPMGEELVVNTYSTGTQWFPRVSQSRDGSFVVVWESEHQDGSEFGVRARRYDPLGDPTGDEFPVNEHTTGSQNTPSVSHGADGSFVVAWQSEDRDGDGYGIRARRYDAAGDPLPLEIAVNSYTTGQQTDADVSHGSDNSFVIAWNSNRSFIKKQRFDAVGGADGGELSVNTYTTGHQRPPSVSHAPNGSSVVVWGRDEDQDGFGDSVHGQRSVGGEFQVNTYAMFESHLEPRVSHGGDGSFVVVWTSYDEIEAQRYDSSGLAVGGETRVNEYTTGFQKYPSVSHAPDGSYLVVWQETVQGGVGGIRGWRFDAAGDPVGEEFQVSSSAFTFYPDVDHGADGFVVAWTEFENLSPSSGRGIRARRFGFDSDEDGIADSLDACPAEPDPDCVFLDGFESGQTSFW